MKDLITTKGRFKQDDDWFNDITREMDKFNIYYQRHKKDRADFWNTYIYDVEYYMNRGLEYFDQLLQKKIVKEYILLPLRIPGRTIGHIALDKHFVIQHIKFYENECYGRERCERMYTDGLKIEDFNKYIGMRIVLKK